VSEEQVALVDESGTVVGSAPRSVMRRDNLPHVVVAVLVRDPAGRVYVHRRTETKDVFPGMYDCFVAGCLLAGEEPLSAARRELAEELGVTGVRLESLGSTWFRDELTQHLCHVWATTYAGPITHQADEIAWGTWLTVDELRAHLAAPTSPTGQLTAFVPDGRALVETLLADGRLA